MLPPLNTTRCERERTRYRPDKRQFMDFNLNKSGLTADLRRHLRHDHYLALLKVYVIFFINGR